MRRAWLFGVGNQQHSAVLDPPWPGASEGAGERGELRGRPWGRQERRGLGHRGVSASQECGCGGASARYFWFLSDSGNKAANGLGENGEETLAVCRPRRRYVPATLGLFSSSDKKP